MLPNKLRLWLFDRLSVKTMRYVTAVPWREAHGLTRDVYEMIADDFFVNGSLTSRSRVPNLLAAIWTGGRESILVDDHLDRTTKEAICALLSEVNECPYCGDMLISLVHAGDQHDAATALFETRVGEINDPRLRAQLSWVEAVSTPGRSELPPTPFSEEQLPEVLASMMAMADINRFSHVVMDGSPVQAPGRLQGLALRFFGGELRATKARPAAPGRALSLLAPASLPADLSWAAPNPRVADAVARWTATVDRETAEVVSPAVRNLVHESLAGWSNERMPMSRGWVEKEVAELSEQDQAVARLALLLAMASYQISDSVVEPLLGDEARFVRILSWASFTAARRFVSVVAEKITRDTEAHAA